MLVTHLIALGFQFGVLIGGKNAFGFFQESGAALFRAAGFHTFCLPGIELGFLVGVEIEAGETAARHLVVRRGFRAASFSAGKHRRRNDERRRDKR